ncbi:MAG: type II secretion system minor pseudopilin GspI [Marinibacterium sp.]
MAQGPDSGFSLIEALVAMTVLAVSAATLLTTLEEHGRAHAAVSDRALALWIAENRLVEIELGLRDLQGVIIADGREWRVDTRFSGTADPDLARADISVAPVSGRASDLARLTGFVRQAGAS